MNPDHVVLSIEEVAYAMGVLGGTDAATGFLLGILGQRPRLEVEGRLLAAAHGLVAREYLEFDRAAGTSWLTKQLEQVIMPLVRSDYSLRLSRVEDGQEVVATLFASERKFVFHQLHKGVVSHLSQLSDSDQAQEACKDFFQLSDSFVGGAAALARVPDDLIDSVRKRSAGQTFADMTAQFVAHGLDPDRAAQLVQDLHADQLRGSIVRLSTEDEKVVSRQGILLLQGTQGCWFFEMKATEPEMMDLFLGDATVFSRLFAGLNG